MAKSSIRDLRLALKCLFNIPNCSFENGGIHSFPVLPNYSILVRRKFVCFHSTPISPLSNTLANSSNNYRSFSRISGIRSNYSAAAHVFYFRNSCRIGRFYSGTSDISKLGVSASNSSLMKPLKAGWTRYKEVIGLQIDAFWKRNYFVIVGASGFIMCFFLWQTMFKIASTFVELSEGMSRYGFLAISASVVAFSGAYVRSRYRINPEKVYRMAMRRLNTSASIVEVMGAPLSGTEIRAYVMSGGGLTLKTFRPNLRSKRCFLIFPIHGSDKKGLVSVEVKKKKGQYNMKLLAVDVGLGRGNDQRIFVVGDENEYRVGGGIIGELRDPVVKAMEAANEFEDIDTIEEKMDSLKEIEEAKTYDNMRNL